MNPTRAPVEGNACLLVLTSSASGYWNHAIVEETVLRALDHFGFPYRVLDLARERLDAQGLAECACLVVAQSGVGECLDQEAADLVARAIDQGMGLVNFDSDLRLYPAPYLGIFGFQGVNPHPFVTRKLRIVSRDHPVTEMQEDGETHTFARTVTAVQVERWGPGVTPLAEAILGKDELVQIRHLTPGSSFEPGNHPVLFAAARGKGRAVQFTVSPRMWRKAFFGHGQALDDLFWRSMAWAARKPFVAAMVPPFLTLSVDDARGRHGLRYVEAAAARGFVPLVSLELASFPAELHGVLRRHAASGQALYGTHCWSYYDLLVYDFGRGERSSQELETAFAREDAWWKKAGLEQRRTLRLHWGEYGRRALPYLKARGRTLFCPALQTGLHKADMCMDDGYWPYDLQSLYWDYLPDDRDFFGFASFPSRHQEDFLTGQTQFAGESERTNVAGAGESMGRRIRHGLRAGFYAEVLTHEQKLGVLSMDEWEAILDRGLAATAGMERLFAGHDEVGGYLRALRGARIVTAAREDARIRYALAGSADVPVRLALFSGDATGLERRWLPLDAFSGSAMGEATA